MRNSFIIAAGAGLLTLSPAAFAAGPESPDALVDAFKAAIVAEDTAAVTALYTEDAASFGPGGGSAEVGHGAIAASWNAFFSAFDGFAVEMEKLGEHEMGDEHHAAWGYWTMSATPAGGGEAIVWKGRFLDVSMNTDDGWKYVADHASMMAPAAQ